MLRHWLAAMFHWGLGSITVGDGQDRVTLISLGLYEHVIIEA